jgi:hypothetical protein
MELKIQQKHIYVAIALLLVFVAILPWFKQGIPATDDFRHHGTKFWFMKYSLQNEGKIAEWMPFIYSGWPLTHFYHSLPYFASLPFIILMGPLTALKASIVTSFILAALAMFFAAKRLFNSTVTASIAAIFYTLAPMHMEYAYLSGSISRLWAYIFLPLVICFFIKLVEEGGRKNLIGTVISIAAVAYTNTGITVALSYFLAAFAIYHFISQKKILVNTVKELVMCGILIVALSMFWVLPYVLESDDSGATYVTEKLIGAAPGPSQAKQIFTRGFGLNIDGKGTRGHYIGYSILALSLLAAFTMKFKYKKIFVGLGAAGIILTLFTAPLKLLPLAPLSYYSLYYLLIAVVFLSFVAAHATQLISKVKNGLLISLIVIAIFVIDVFPAQQAVHWSPAPTEDYTNSKEILDAFAFIKKQPGIFRTYPLVGEMSYIYTEKPEIGLEFTGYTEGAFKPIRVITNDILNTIRTNLTNGNAYATLGYMGAKYIVLPCIPNFDKFIPLAYSNNAVCVYENPAFAPLIVSPERVAISTTPTQSDVDAYILEPCISNCMLQKNKASISNVKFELERISFTANASESSFVLVKSSYFAPHWHAYVNGRETLIRKAWPYYMLIEVPPGTANIEFKYRSNAAHAIGNIISILALIAICWIALPQSLRNKFRKTK